ncbi:uncharacterized protein SPPG_03104 [Spizellomyces punctatus DAOM BR117]|uniref:Peptidase M48 domain-containing protein n=1 Tax=Spizellomyces punctatus (strain DAOM BR117) TaxID=645134 RepID=A0A0L0HKD8_SPIPD|nr:uncharacterized protein SPPG_03104 [Spizellomyces punctatus DAOM BR117]KND01294.1 hypothetical protein SPPG_03104 [Spizellomyces punctatus DAOM BR117]|eukprot:XP_016609333.1 hypothetical protein SPPG_03104 [Spizellomyces punctatus DAOM BR117]
MLPLYVPALHQGNTCLVMSCRSFLLRFPGSTRTFARQPQLSPAFRTSPFTCPPKRNVQNIQLRAFTATHSRGQRIIIQPGPEWRGRRDQEYEYFKQQPPPFWQNKTFLMWTAAGGGLFGAYYVSHLETVPITGRKRFIDVTPQQEKMMAKQAFQQVMAQYGPKILPSWHPYSLFVRRVAERLIKVTGMSNLHWEVYVIEDPQKNAFVLPGGKIFVFTGLIPIVEDENGMAAVLGHEIAHQIARHSAEKLSWAKILIVAQLLMAYIFDPGMLFSRLFLELGILMPFSRKMESEADYIGLRLMAQACYDPVAAVGLWERMKEAQRSSKLLEYVSTHPSPEKRIQKITEWLPEAEMIREESDCEHTASIMDSFRHLPRPIW